MPRRGSFFAEGSLIVEAVLNWLLKTCCFPIVDLLYVEMMWLAIPALENLSSELLIMYHSSAKEMERKPFQAVLFLLPLKEPTVLLLSLILLSFPWNSLQTSAASYEQGINGFIFHSVQKGINQELSFYSRLSDGTDTLCFSEESQSNKFGSLVLSTKLNFESTYRLVVVASNKLGSAFSQPLKFMLIDIGKCLAYLLSVSAGYLEKVQTEHSVFVV